MASIEIGLEVNYDKIEYRVISRDQNAGRIHSIRNDNSSFERMDEFKYMGTTLSIHNFIQEEIKCRMKSGNGCYHSVQKLVSSSFLSTNLKKKIYRNIFLRVVLYGCEDLVSYTEEEGRLRLFENRVLRGIYGPMKVEVTREWRKLHNEELNDLYSSSIIVQVIKSRRMRWAVHVARMGERRGIYRVLVGKPGGERETTVRPRCR